MASLIHHPRTTAPTKCRGCGEVKPADEFSSEARKKNGLRSYCKPCSCRTTATAIIAQRNSNLKRKFGIDLDEYNRMYAEQEGKCGICGEHETVKGRVLNVDHCHETGVIRGLLCFNCNTSLGKLGDNVEGIERVLAYLHNSS